MIDAIVASLGGPKEPFPWLVVLALVILTIAYALLEVALGYGVRSLWRWAIRLAGGQKKGRPKGRP